MNSYGHVSSKTEALTHSFLPLCFCLEPFDFPFSVTEGLFLSCHQECLVIQSAP